MHNLNQFITHNLNQSHIIIHSPRIITINFSISNDNNHICQDKISKERKEEKKEGMTYHGSNYIYPRGTLLLWRRLTALQLSQLPVSHTTITTSSTSLQSREILCTDHTLTLPVLKYKTSWNNPKSL